MKYFDQKDNYFSISNTMGTNKNVNEIKKSILEVNDKFQDNRYINNLPKSKVIGHVNK